jgi:hypothetical protein
MDLAVVQVSGGTYWENRCLSSDGMGAASQIPRHVAAAIKKCWPEGIVEEFDTDESYFHEIHSHLERDLRNIRGAALLWQSEAQDSDISRDNDRKDEPPPSEDWQSYHLFFVAPDGKEFHFEDEIEGGEKPEDPEDEEWTGTTYLGEGWIGCAVGICLAARFAAINLDSFSQYEDGSRSLPDVECFILSEETNERVDSGQYYREILGEKAFQRLQDLRSNITAILAKYRIQVLDKSILDLRVPSLATSEEVFLEKPLRVRDAFFFHGV